jgi:hypothetical protein
MIYFIVITSIFTNDLQDKRNEEYILGITTLLTTAKQFIPSSIKYKIIIVENGGRRPIFLQMFVDENPHIVELFFTTNNYRPIKNKGCKELFDIFDCISTFNIDNDDFIVKITGRYVLQPNPLFFHALIENKYDSILRYGSYFSPVNYKMSDCITFLIGLKM